MWFDFLREQARIRPESIGLIDHISGQTLRFKDLDELANRWAHTFLSMGLKPGDRLAFLSKNVKEHLIWLFACSRINATLVPLNYKLTESEISPQLAQVKPQFVIHSPEFEACKTHPSICFDSLVLSPKTESLDQDDRALDHVALILFTSGSTGVPKGVMLHRGMLLWNAIQTEWGWKLQLEDFGAVQTPFFHTGGYNVLALPLWRIGGAIHLFDQFDAEQTLKLIHESQITTYFGVPTMFQALAKHQEFAQTSFQDLRFCISGGAPLPGQVRQKFEEKEVWLRQGFGLTEVGPNCFYTTDAHRDRPETIGYPMPHTQVRIKPLVDSEPDVGELCIRGPHVCSGYWNNPKAFDLSREGDFFCTGDLVKRHSDGCFEVFGRKKEMYISGGENVYPTEVVRVLLQHPSILAAEVLAVPDSKWGEVGYAFVMAENLTLEDLKPFLSENLSRYKHPKFLRCLDSFPLLANGKVDKKTLQKWALEEVHVG